MNKFITLALAAFSLTANTQFITSTSQFDYDWNFANEAKHLSQKELDALKSLDAVSIEVQANDERHYEVKVTVTGLDKNKLVIKMHKIRGVDLMMDDQKITIDYVQFANGGGTHLEIRRSILKDGHAIAWKTNYTQIKKYATWNNIATTINPTSNTVTLTLQDDGLRTWRPQD